MTTPAALIEERQKIKAYLAKESARFNDHCKPFNERMQKIDAELLDMMHKQGVESYKTEHGTAYMSTIVTPSITDKEKYLDFVLENWDKWGAMLQIGAPQKATLQTYMDENGGRLPPFVETSSMVRLNVRQS